ncbi:hypothetical protein ABZP36_022396 [Zizania latifolia]
MSSSSYSTSLKEETAAGEVSTVARQAHRPTGYSCASAVDTPLLLSSRSAAPIEAPLRRPEDHEDVDDKHQSDAGHHRAPAFSLPRHGSGSQRLPLHSLRRILVESAIIVL